MVESNRKRKSPIEAATTSARLSYDKTHKKYFSEYHLIFSNIEKIRKVSRTHGLFKVLIMYFNSDLLNQNEMYQIYIRFRDTSFKPKNYTSFSKKFRQCRIDGIKETLIHGLFNKQSNSSKVKEFHLKVIKKYYSDKAKYSAEQITDYVNRDALLIGYDQISSSTVRRVIRAPDFQVIHGLKRYGYTYFTKEYLPYLTREKPFFSGEVWQIDGTGIPFASINEQGEYQRLILFVVFDVHSSMILGHSISHSENAEMVIEAVCNASMKHSHLPYEVVYDNGAALKSSHFQTIVNRSSFYGVEWRRHRPHNPGDKGQIERFNRTFQERFCKKEEGYLGGSPTSKSIDSRPSKEEMVRIIKKGNLKSRNWINTTMDRLLAEYNNTGLNGKKSPRVQYEFGLSKGKSITLAKNQIIDIFWKSKTIKLSRGTIAIAVDNRQYRYPSYDFEFLSKYGNTRVLVKYNPKDLSVIYLFDLKSRSFIESLKQEQKVPVARIEHTTKDKQRIRGHYKKIKALVRIAKQDGETVDSLVHSGSSAIASLSKPRIRKEYPIYIPEHHGN